MGRQPAGGQPAAGQQPAEGPPAGQLGGGHPGEQPAAVLAAGQLPGAGANLDLVVKKGPRAPQHRRHPAEAASFKETAYDVTIAATQQIKAGQYGRLIATVNPGARAKEATNRKRAYFKGLVARAAITGTAAPGVGRLRFQPLAFEDSGFTAPPVRHLVDGWAKSADERLGPGHTVSARASARRELSSTIHYWNSVCIILRGGAGLTVHKSPHLISDGRGM